MQHISFIEIKTNDTWIRDYGPHIIFDSQSIKYLDIEFNAWGERYKYDLDNKFSEKLYSALCNPDMEYTRIPVVIEGGNLDFNSQGALLTNLSSIKQNNVREKFNDAELIKSLKSIFNVSQVIGINLPPIEGDDTGGHIDTLARFINDETIVYAATKNSDNPNFSCLEMLYKQLMAIHNQSYKYIPLDIPSTLIKDQDGNLLPASYINYVFLNESLLVPLYNDPNDAVALKTYSKLCPDRKVIGIDASELIQQFGSLHCATLNLPMNTQ